VGGPQEYRILKFVVGFLGPAPFSCKKAVLWILVMRFGSNFAVNDRGIPTIEPRAGLVRQVRPQTSRIALSDWIPFFRQKAVFWIPVMRSTNLGNIIGDQGQFIFATALNSTITDDIQGSGRGLIQVISRHLPEDTAANTTKIV